MQFQKHLSCIWLIVTVFSSSVALATVIKKATPLQSGNVEYSFVQDGEVVARQLVEAVSGEVMKTTGAVPDGPVHEDASEPRVLGGGGIIDKEARAVGRVSRGVPYNAADVSEFDLIIVRCRGVFVI